MITIISHRGNIEGPSNIENTYTSIRHALNMGYDVEVDLYYDKGNLYLGHDKPEEKFNLNDFTNEIEKNKFWFHCKNYKCLEYFNSINIESNYFWHKDDDYTLTSKNKIWVYPGKELINGSICVKPGMKIDDSILKCYGVCTDYPADMKKAINTLINKKSVLK